MGRETETEMREEKNVNENRESDGARNNRGKKMQVRVRE